MKFQFETFGNCLHLQVGHDESNMILIANLLVSPLENISLILFISYRVHFCQRIPSRVSPASIFDLSSRLWNTYLKLDHHADFGFIYIGTHTCSIESPTKTSILDGFMNFRARLYRTFSNVI